MFTGTTIWILTHGQLTKFSGESPIYSSAVFVLLLPSRYRSTSSGVLGMLEAIGVSAAGGSPEMLDSHVDEIHFAPPKKPWLKPLFVEKPRETKVCWYLLGNHPKPGFLSWCRISPIHSMFAKGTNRNSALSGRLGPIGIVGALGKQ